MYSNQQHFRPINMQILLVAPKHMNLKQLKLLPVNWYTTLDTYYCKPLAHNTHTTVPLPCPSHVFFINGRYMIYHKCYHDRKEGQEMPTAKLWRRGGAILRRVDRRRLSFLFDFGCLLLRRHSRRWRERPQTQGQGTSNKHKKTSTLHSLKSTK